MSTKTNEKLQDTVSVWETKNGFIILHILNCKIYNWYNHFTNTKMVGTVFTIV